MAGSSPAIEKVSPTPARLALQISPSYPSPDVDWIDRLRQRRFARDDLVFASFNRDGSSIRSFQVVTLIPTWATLRQS
jgi:hypothetical protein